MPPGMKNAVSSSRASSLLVALLWRCISDGAPFPRRVQNLAPASMAVSISASDALVCPREPGPLHLTGRSDLLDLELSPAALSLYDSP